MKCGRPVCPLINELVYLLNVSISGRTAVPMQQQPTYQQLLQQYQHPAAAPPVGFLQQQQQQQQQAAAIAAAEYQMDNDVKTYVSVKADPIEPTRVKYTCNACQFSPKNLGLLVEHINGVHLKRKAANPAVAAAGMFGGAKPAGQAAVNLLLNQVFSL
jgi:hypothetical protein